MGIWPSAIASRSICPGPSSPTARCWRLDAALRLTHASGNATEWLDLATPPAPGLPLRDALPSCWSELPLALQAWLEGAERLLLSSGSASDGRRATALARRTRNGGVLLEFEPGHLDLQASGRLQSRVQTDLEQMGQVETVSALCGLAATRVRALTAFNRVLVYRFTDAWDGVVVAEDGDGVLPSYLGLRFPASDIPAQARELYRLNRVRIIPDSDYTPSPIAALGGGHGCAARPQRLDPQKRLARTLGVHAKHGHGRVYVRVHPCGGPPMGPDLLPPRDASVRGTSGPQRLRFPGPDRRAADQRHGAYGGGWPAGRARCGAGRAADPYGAGAAVLQRLGVEAGRLAGADGSRGRCGDPGRRYYDRRTDAGAFANSDAGRLAHPERRRGGVLHLLRSASTLRRRRLMQRSPAGSWRSAPPSCTPAMSCGSVPR